MFPLGAQATGHNYYTIFQEREILEHIQNHYASLFHLRSILINQSKDLLSFPIFYSFEKIIRYRTRQSQESTIVLETLYANLIFHLKEPPIIKRRIDESLIILKVSIIPTNNLRYIFSKPTNPIDIK